jgi:Tfp pilus assembly protein PilX
MNRHRLESHGAAVVIVLAFIVIITILIVGLASSMRVDRPAANSHLEKTRAAIYAQTGVENVLATLNQYTTGSSYWISQPGQLVVGTPSDDTSTTVDERTVLKITVPLYSGTATITATDAQFASPNLNVPMWRDPDTHLITDRADPADASQTVSMKVGWIYVTQDGQASKVLRYNAASNANAAEWIDNPDYNHNTKTNPIVGRYAYWTDDESSKVNYNLAWKRSTSGTPGNTFPPGHPTKVDLTALSGITSNMADAIHGYLVSGTNYSTLLHGFFNTPGDARQVDTVCSGVAAALQNNKFEVTHYNHDPDTTFFNLPRIVLTTQKSRAGGKPFLDIGITDTTKL